MCTCASTAPKSRVYSSDFADGAFGLQSCGVWTRGRPCHNCGGSGCTSSHKREYVSREGLSHLSCLQLTSSVSVGDPTQYNVSSTSEQNNDVLEVSGLSGIAELYPIRSSIVWCRLPSLTGTGVDNGCEVPLIGLDDLLDL